MHNTTIFFDKKIYRYLTPEDLKKLHTPSYSRMFIDFFLVLLQALVGIIIYTYTENLFVFLTSVLIIGSAQHGMSMIAHEGAHQHIYKQNIRINDAITRWIFAAPILLPFSLYRARHLEHHKYVSTELDTKNLYKRNISGTNFFYEVILSLAGIDYLRQVRTVLFKQKSANIVLNDNGVNQFKKNIIYDLVSIILSQIIILSLVFMLDYKMYILMWLIPIFTTSMLFAKLRSLVEHHPYSSIQQDISNNAYFLGSAGPCLRSVDANWIERFLISKVNFHYHAEHHIWPQISYQHLPKAHQILVENHLFDNKIMCCDKNYFTVLLKLYMQN